MVKSPMSDVDIPEVSIPQIFSQILEVHADRVGVVDGVTEQQYTFTEIGKIVRRLASALTKHGLRQRDIVAFFSPNSPEYIFMFYAVLSCGATCTTINPVYTVYELSKHLEDSKPKFIFASPETAATSLKAAQQTGVQQKCIVSGSYPGCLSVSELLRDDGSNFPENVDINVREDLATIPYSSGTTGFPKGVMITHYNLVSMLMIMAHPDMLSDSVIAESGEQRVTVNFLPFFHAYGMVGTLIGSILKGDKQVILPRFEPERFLRLVEKYRATSLSLVPPVVLYFNKSPLVQKYDLSSVVSVSCGAAPLSKDSENEFLKLMKVPEIKQGYGMTETTVAICYPPSNARQRPGSCGVPLANCEMQVVDPNTNKVLSSGEKGEIWVKGPNIMKGYLNRPDATRDTFGGDGWLRTGDIGYYDEDKYFYIVDRMKELIKFKGFQVAPAELEALLLNHPQIDDVAVIGVPDTEAGELPKAYVVRKPGTNITEQEVKQYVADHMSSFKHLRGGVEFLASVPKSQSGKILRRELRDKLQTSKL